MRNMMITVCAMVLMGCGASAGSFTYANTSTYEASVGDNDPMLADLMAACEGTSAHRTRGVHTLIQVRPGFQASCH